MSFEFGNFGYRQAMLGVVLVSAALIGWVEVTSGSGTAVGEPARVCVVDLERVFDSAPQREAMESSLQARDEEIVQLVKERRKELDRLKGELALLASGSAEYQRIQREMVQKQADLKFQSEQYDKEMASRVLRARENLLNEIEAVVASVCDREGFDIVLQREFKIPKTAVVWNTAFFARPMFDITDRIIEALKN